MLNIKIIEFFFFISIISPFYGGFSRKDQGSQDPKIEF